MRTLETFEDRRFYFELSIFELQEKLKLSEATGSESKYSRTIKNIIVLIVQYRTIRSHLGHRSSKWAMILYVEMNVEEQGFNLEIESTRRDNGKSNGKGVGVRKTCQKSVRIVAGETNEASVERSERKETLWKIKME